MISRSLVLALMLVCGSANLASGQSFAAEWQMTIDDLGPAEGDDWGAVGGPIEMLHAAALVVKVADFDQDGDDDILLGGNSGFGVRIYYLDANTPGWIAHTEILPITDVVSAYDVYLGLFDDDTFVDVVVGRRLSCTKVQNGDRDKIFLNNASPVAHSDHFTITATDLPNPDADASCLGETFSVRVDDVDGDGHEDILEAGNYGIHFLRGDGLGGFQFVTTYFDQGSQGNYRSLELGDVDGDGDDDMVAARMNGFRTRVYFSRRNDAGFDPNNPFELAPNQPDLDWAPIQDISWRLVCSKFASLGVLEGEGQTFGVELADLDNDGDLDLVAASLKSRSTVYLNNGDGYFGSEDDAMIAPFNDGEPAFLFPALTRQFRGQSTTMDFVFTGPGNDLPAAPAGCFYSWTVPGVYVNWNTDVNITDINGDGLLDVALSNRNDIGDAFAAFGEEARLPDTWDFLFFNRSQGKADIRFDPCVERLGKANDGTGYGEFHNLNPNPGVAGANTDDRPEWLDANFANFSPEDDATNRVWWGLPLVAANCDQMDDQTHLTIPVDLHLSTRQEVVGGTWQIFGSATGMWPANPPQINGVDVPLVQDCLYDHLVANPLTGTVPSPPDTAIAVDVPATLPCIANDLYFAVGVFDPLTNALRVAHPVRTPLQSPL